MDTPFLLILISAVLGAGFLAYTMRQYNIGVRLSAGALAGVVGMLFFMFPLNFCTFDPERKPIDFIFGIILIAVGMAIALFTTRFLLGLFANRENSPIEAEYPPGAFRANFLVPLLLLAPTLIILALFLYYPAIDTFRLSTLLTRLGISRTAFVCVDNFTRLAGDADYLNSLGVTVFMSVAIVVLGQSLGLFIATMAYQPVKGAKIYRALLIWPYSISPVVAGMIFLLLFNPTGGIINHFLFNVVGTRIPWLNDPLFAPWTVILASVWKSLGFNILFYIAGLQNVPNDLKEAAAIDGANAFQRFFRIVVPMLSPISFFLMITNTTYAIFDTFGTIDYLTGGGPLKSTTTLMYNVYQVGVQNHDLGKAAAQSIVLFVMVIGLTLIQFRTAGRQVNYGA